MKTRPLRTPIGAKPIIEFSVRLFRDASCNWFAEVQTSERLFWTATYTKRSEALEEAADRASLRSDDQPRGDFEETTRDD